MSTRRISETLADYQERRRREQRKWQADNPARWAAVQRRYRATHPGHDRVRKRRWVEQNREKMRAHRAVAKAVAMGRLIALSSCSVCSATGKIEGHHLDYEKRLEVVWLCVKCHKKRHATGLLPQ